MRSNNKILMHAPFPPPVHGAANVSLYIAKCLADRGAVIVQLNVATPFQGNAITNLLNRIGRSTLAVLRVLLASKGAKNTVMYLAVSKGYGQWFDLLAICSARLRRFRLALHFHNYSVVKSKSLLTRLISASAGKGAVLIFLCEGMRDKAECWKPAERKSHVVSNAALLESGNSDIPEFSELSKNFPVLGYFSRVTSEKGVYRFIELVKFLRAKNFVFAAEIAGNFIDARTERAVSGQAELVGITVVGPVYGSSKIEFLQGIDILIFPSTYPHEAEPLVVYEALARGVRVVAFDIGCLGGLRNLYGITLSNSEDLADDVRDILNEGSLSIDRNRVVGTFKEIKVQAVGSLNDLFSELLRYP